MKFIYAFCVILVLGAGLWFSFYINEQPRSISRIEYSPYDSSNDFVSLLHSNLQNQIKSAPILLLGVTPGSRQDLEFWKAFLELNTDPTLAYKAIVIDPKLPGAAEIFPESVKMDFKNELQRFSEGAKNAQAQSLRMAVIVPTIYSAQVLEEGPAHLLKMNYQLQPTSLSLVRFPRALPEEANVEHPCKIGDQDRDGTGALGCLIQNRSRPLYRVSPAPDKFEGIVDQLGERDFLIYWNPPISKQN